MEHQIMDLEVLELHQFMQKDLAIQLHMLVVAVVELIMDHRFLYQLDLEEQVVVEQVQQLTIQDQILMQFKVLLVLEGVVVEQVQLLHQELHQELREQMVVLELL
tara:strand:- start:624 stop:938 length:315 start_codon:yes stop_codon:yes gene_type:complete